MIASLQNPPTTATGHSEALWSLGCLFVLKAETPELEVIDALVPAGYSPPLHQHDFGSGFRGTAHQQHSQAGYG